MTERGGPHLEISGFSGPLELLFHLVTEREMSVETVELGSLVDQYLSYLSVVQELSIDDAGEFLYMAAQLAYLKSKSLLPPEEQPVDEETPIEQAERLREQLKQYERFKRAANYLSERDLLNRDVFERGSEQPVPRKSGPVIPEFKEVSVFKLVDLFGEIVRQAPKEVIHEVLTDKISVSRRMTQMIERLETSGYLDVKEIFPELASRRELIVSFLALLELAKHQMIQIYQNVTFGHLRVVVNSDRIGRARSLLDAKSESEAVMEGGIA